nr:peptidase family M48 family protein [Tanacetum cinerariifolium]
MSYVSESIAKSIMFIGTTHAIWQLETRFALSNGSHKYKLNKETYDTMQSGKPVSEYYTSMKCIWEELDSMNELPRITSTTTKIVVFLKALNTQKEEQSVETACALHQQEESQRGVFGSRQLGVESTVLYNKDEIKEKYSICGFKWHPPEKCWEKVGYPFFHHKNKQNQKSKGVAKSGNAPVKRTTTLLENGGHVVFTSKQFEQLMKSIPYFHQQTGSFEMENPFGEGIVYCFSCINGVIRDWIIDTGASDHMSPDSDDLNNVCVLKNKQVINLPNGHTSVISKVGNIVLENKIELKNVLIVPSF